jgi:hypothetical protein
MFNDEEDDNEEESVAAAGCMVDNVEDVVWDGEDAPSSPILPLPPPLDAEDGAACSTVDSSLGMRSSGFFASSSSSSPVAAAAAGRPPLGGVADEVVAVLATMTSAELLSIAALGMGVVGLLTAAVAGVVVIDGAAVVGR